MGLFTQLEKFGQKLARGYACWRRQVWRTLVVILVLVVLWDIGQVVQGGPGGGMILEIYNGTNHPILGLSANGVASVNAFANGGGSITCCSDVNEGTTEVVWTLSTTRTQYSAGTHLEKQNMALPLPKRKRREDFLRVYFIPGDEVLLGWGKDSFSPYKGLHGGRYKTRVRRDVKDKLYGTGKMN